MLKATLLVSTALLALALGAPDERILNGQVVQSPEAYPYKCGIHYLLNAFRCGCIILNEEYVLTSARCAQGLNSGLTVHVGSNHITAGGANYDVQKKTEHFDFAGNDPFSPDIAIIQLRSAMVFDNFTGPVTLPVQDQETPAGSAAVIIGWGYTAQSGPNSPNLMEADATIMDLAQCATWYSSEGIITDRHLCTTNQGGGVCNGDNGGPMMVDGVLHGVVTWTSTECATVQGFPGVYTRVASFRTWITDITGI